MKKNLLALGLIISGTCNSQTWNKISGIMDSTQIKSVAEINNQVVVAGQNWISNGKADFAVSTDGNSWTQIPTYSFAGWFPTGLPQNNLIVNPNGFTNTRKLVAGTWQAFNFQPYNYAEFSNGTIIGGSAGYPDTLYNISNTGVKGAKLGNQKFKLSSKYCNGANNRLFIFSYGSGLGYIDFNNLSVINYPATFNGQAMTKTSWELHSVTDMVRTSNGNLFATDQLYGIIKSTDNGVNWTTVLSGVAGISITKNSTDELFVVIGSAQIRKSSDGGVTFTNINGNLPANGFKADVFVNAINEVFAFINNNGAINPSNSGIYKLSNLIGLKETNKTIPYVSLFPNPTNGRVNIQAETALSHIKVMDLTGKIIVEDECSEKNYSLSLDKVERGLYFVSITINEVTQVIKVIKD